jgi:four helix bundle protein
MSFGRLARSGLFLRAAVARAVLSYRVMAGVRSHTELDAWKLADELRTEVNRLIALRPLRFRPKLIEQLLDASESACSNLAEGFSRFYPKDHARFVRISKGSLSEVIDRLEAAVERRLFSKDEIARAVSLARRARGACLGLVRYLETADAPSARPREGEPRNPEPRNRRT